MIKHNIFYVFSILIVFFLIFAPFVGVYFRMLNTLNHEIGHALVSLLTGGGVRDIRLYKNTSGVAHVSSTKWIGRVATVLAGYPAASFAAALSAYILVTEGPIAIIVTFIIVISISAVLWTRNAFGMAWSMCFVTVSILVYFEGDFNLRFTYALILVEIILIESLISGITIYKLSIKDKDNAGDAKDLAKLTRLPTTLWGGLFFIQALFFTSLGFYMLFYF